jgi:RND superfamily putative drug exporter
MFSALGRAVARHPMACLLAWAAAAILPGAFAPSPDALAAREPASIVPDGQPYIVAVELARKAFPQVSATTRTVLVFHRPGGLAESDHVCLAQVAQRLTAEAAGRWRVLAPATHPYLASRLVSADGSAVMIVVCHDLNYLTHKCTRQVDAVEDIARRQLPTGLTLEITGEGGLGRDVTRGTRQAYHRTTWVTVLAVLAILVLVYRAPLAAAVPLVSIGLSVFVAIQLLNRLAMLGWAISDLERTFAVVLLFGSGTDFAMFWMARYWEQSHGTDSAQAFESATAGTGPAIVASAATTIVGLLMLMLADLPPTHNAGRALGLALAVSMLAALTLTPALARLMGRRLFWPRRSAQVNAGVLWPRVAAVVVRRPGTVLLVMALLLAWPAWRGWRIGSRYDAFGIVSAQSSAARGQTLAEAHFTSAELFSWTVLVECPPDPADRTALDDLATELGARCRAIEGITDVWSVDRPLGVSPAGRLIPRGLVTEYYVRQNPPCVRVEVMQPFPPLSTEGMKLCSRMMADLGRWASDRVGRAATVHATGLTPYILNVKRLADADQRRIMAWVAAAVGMVVLVWIRRPGLTLCMVAATLVVYLATLGAADLFFAKVLGRGELDWKVKLFLFVIMMAVGQDYNLFLVSRIVQERRTAGARDATACAIVTTGRVISSCGLIMAATLGSIAATGLTFYQQLGFAFAFGVLLDTFVIRPAVVPACYLLGDRRQDKGLDVAP